MAENRTSARQSRRRVRVLAAWVMSAAVVGAYYFIDEEDSAPATTIPVPKTGEKVELDILEVKPNEATPGSAVEVTFIGAKGDAPITARFSQSIQEFKGDADILHRADNRVFVRVPNDAKLGAAKLRLQQGEQKSKPYDLRVEPVNHRKLFRSVIGGLALLVFGLATLSTGSRAYAGQRSQGVIARVARRTPAAMGLGLVIGGVTQFTTTAAGLVVGLIESHLLAVVPAAAILLGTQLGAAATPALLGLATTKDSLLVVVLGVIWTTLAVDRRSRALGKIILGCGLLFYGLHVLRVGFEPLVADPEILPYMNLFHADTLPGLLTCVLAGTLMAAALQGPGPVFVLVLGLAQSSGRIDLQSALAILAGTGVGAAIGTNIVAWPFGPESRRLARIHLAIALFGTILLAASVDAWAFVADALVSGHPDEVAYGKKVLLPNIGRHMVVGFLASQVVVTFALAALLPVIGKLVRRVAAPVPGGKAGALLGTAGVNALRSGLVRVLSAQRSALQATIELCLTGHRARGTESEHALGDARHELEQLFAGAVRSRSNEPEMGRLRQAALATLQLQRAVEDLLTHAERSTERNMALSPAGESWQLASSDAATLKALHGLLLEGVDGLIQQLETGTPSELDNARAREIRLNAMEMETRQALLQDADRGQEPHAIALRLNNTDVVNAYENVGNHLYRLHEALAAEVDQDDFGAEGLSYPALSSAPAGGGDQGH